MDFSWSTAQQKLYDEVVAFAQQELDLGDVAARDLNCQFARAAWNQCAAFGKECTPRKPLGATMVSSEGACAAYFQYGRFAALDQPLIELETA